METMTPKERIDAVIKHQAVDRTPFTVVDGGAWIAKTEGVTYRELYSRPDSGASSVVDYLNKIDSDMISAFSLHASTHLAAQSVLIKLEVQSIPALFLKIQ